jgi:hypothetical protein
MLKRRTEAGLMELTEHDDIRNRRRRAVKTAWALAIVAIMIFVAFILSGVLGT